MLVIRTKEELRSAYTVFLRVKNVKGIEENVKMLLRDIRRYCKLPISNVKCIKSDFDTAVFKIFCPENLLNERDVVDYFNANHVLKTNSAFGCTGKLFTVDYKIAKQNGKWVVYHTIGRDC